MIERRGSLPRSKREQFYCSTCKKTSAFQQCVIENPKPTLAWKCIGGERSTDLHPGCGKIMPEAQIVRLYGECFSCKMIRRCFKDPAGKYRCLYCSNYVENAQAMQ